jgi:uncharacterized protein YyaL (SSP411 family)
MPLAMPLMCASAALAAAAPLRLVVVAGALAAHPAAAQALLEAAHADYGPDKAIAVIDTADAGDVAAWRALNPEALAMAAAHFEKVGSSSPTAFVCQNFSCQAPTTDAAQLRRLLAQRPRQAGASVAPTPVSWPGL